MPRFVKIRILWDVRRRTKRFSDSTKKTMVAAVRQGKTTAWFVVSVGNIVPSHWTYRSPDIYRDMVTLSNHFAQPELVGKP